MEAVKKTKDYVVLKKRSGRFAVQNIQNQYVKGEEKTKILLKEGLIKLSTPKKKEEAAEAAASTAPATPPA